jgi:circadian clock protein KaiB
VPIQLSRKRRATLKSKQYVLRLYTSGSTPRSARAIRNLKRICEARLHGRYQLTVIDIYQQPGLAHDDQIIATPTLIKEEPAPRRILVGDFSRDDRVLAGLSLAPIPAAS